MKERPFVAYQHEVRAILDGRKTQTRRPIKPQPNEVWTTLNRPCKYVKQTGQGWSFDIVPAGMPTTIDLSSTHIKCPYGIPGDRLWVRETWGAHRITGTAGGNSYYEYPNVLYRADSSTRLVIGDEVWGYVEDSFRWRPSIHMPRWASRITLEVTDVRVERVQEISYDDTLKEGVIETGNASAKTWEDAEISGVVRRQYVDSKGRRCMMFGAKAQFANLWDSIYSQRGYGWDANPWVWVVEFVASEDWR